MDDSEALSLATFEDAVARAKDLDVTRRALSASVESLRLIAAAERANAASFRRRLADAERRAREAADERDRLHAQTKQQNFQSDDSRNYSEVTDCKSKSHVALRDTTLDHSVDHTTNQTNGSLVLMQHRYKQQMDQEQGLRTQLEDNLNASRDSCQLLRNNLDVANATVQARDEQLRMCHDDLSKANSALENERQQCTERDDTIQSLNSECADMKLHISSLEEKLFLYENKLNSSAEAVSALDVELTLCKERVIERNGLLDEARQAEQHAREEARACRVRIAELEIAQETKELISSELIETAAREKAARIHADAARDVSVCELANERAKNEKFREENCVARRELEQQSTVIERLNSDLQELRSSKATADKEAAALQRTVEADKASLAALQADLSSAAEATSHVFRLRERVSALEELLAVAEIRVTNASKCVIAETSDTGAAESLSLEIQQGCSFSSLTESACAVTSPNAAASSSQFVNDDTNSTSSTSSSPALPPDISVESRRIEMSVPSENDIASATAKLVLDLRDARAHAMNNFALVEELRAALSEKRVEENENESKCEHLRLRSEKLETDLSTARHEASEANVNADRLQCRVDEIEQTLANLQSELRESCSTVHDLRSMLSAKAEKCSALEKTADSLTDTIINLEAISVSHEEDIKSAKSLLSFAHGEIERLETERTALLSSNSLSASLRTNLVQKSGSGKWHYNGEEDTATSLSLQRISELDSSLSSAKAEVTQKSLEIQRLSALVSRNEAELLASHEKLMCSQTELERQRQILRSCEQKLRQYECEISALKSDVMLKTDEIADRSRQIEHELVPQLEASRAESRKKSAEIADHMLQLAEFRATSEKTRSLLEQEVAATCSRLESTRVALESTQERLTTSEKRGVELDETIVRLITNIRDGESRMEALEEDLRHRIASLSALKAHLDQIEVDNARKDQELIDSGRNIAEMKNELDRLVDRVSVSESRASRRDEEFVLWERATEKSAHEFSVLKTDYEELLEKERRYHTLADELAQTLGARETALDEQARLVAQREACFDLETNELKSAKLNCERGIKVLETENAATQRQLAEVSNLLRETELSLQEARDNAVERNAEVHRLKRELRLLEDAGRVKDTELRSVSAQLKSRQEDVRARDHRISAQNEVIADQEGRIAGLRAESTAANRLIDDLHSEIAKLRSSLDDDKDFVRRLQDEIDNLKIEITRINDERANLAEEATSLYKTISEKEQAASQLRSAMDDLQVKLEATADLANSRVETMDRMKHEMSMLESHLEGHDTLMREYQVLQQTVDNLSQDLETANKKSESGVVERRDLLHRVSAACALSEQLAREKSDLESAKELLMNNLQDLSKLKDQKEEELHSVIDNCRATEAKLLRENADVICQMKTLSSTRERELASSVAEIAQLHSTCDSQAQHIRELKVDIDVKTEALTRLDAELKRSNSSQKSLARSLETLKAEIADRSAYLAEIESGARESSSSADSGETVEGLRAKIRAKEKAIENLHGWCSFINSKLNEAERSLEEHQAHLQVSSKAFEKLSEQRDGNNSESVPDESARDGRDASRKSQHFSRESSYLLEEVRKSEAAVLSAKETANTWRKKFEEIKPIADLAEDAQREVRLLQSKLEITEREAIQQLDVMTMELETCRADRDAAERECAVAVGDNAVMKSRLVEVQKGVGSSTAMYAARYNISAAERTACRVTIILDESSMPFPPEESKIGIVGGDSILGNWVPEKRQHLRMTRTGDGMTMWKCELHMPRQLRIEFKFVAEIPNGDVIWEAGENRVLDLNGASSAHMQGQWRV